MTLPISSTQAPAESRLGSEKPPTIPTEDARIEAGTLKHLNMEAAPLVSPDRAPFCCVGIDTPGVGRVHSPGCALRAWSYVVGESPETLRRFLDGESLHVEISAADFEGIRQLELVESKRERLLCQLIFAAKDLAERNLLPSLGKGFNRLPASCAECCMTDYGGRIAHESTCRTGRVLGILRDLTATLPEFNPEGKEAALDGETERAGDGIRPRGIRPTEGEFGELWKLLSIDYRHQTATIATGNGIARQFYDLSGTFPNLIAAAHRIIACINFCAGVPSEYLKDYATLALATIAKRKGLQILVSPSADCNEGGAE